MSMNVDEFEGRPELVKKRARALIFQRAFFGAIGIFMVSSITLLVVNALQGQTTRDTLLDCTQPTGECSQRNQERTGVLIQQLIDNNSLGDIATQRIVVLAAACSEEPAIRDEPVQSARIALLEACVNDQLKADENRKGN